MKTIIIGIGNPMLTDDGVGVQVARLIKERMAGLGDIEITELYTGGLRLMEAMVGYEKAFIVDSIITGESSPGAFYVLSPSDFLSSRNIICAHDTDFSAALEMGRLLGLKLPSEISIWAIEAEDVSTFSEKLTPALEKALPVVADRLISQVVGCKK